MQLSFLIFACYTLPVTVLLFYGMLFFLRTIPSPTCRTVFFIPRCTLSVDLPLIIYVELVLLGASLRNLVFLDFSESLILYLFLCLSFLYTLQYSPVQTLPQRLDSKDWVSVAEALNRTRQIAIFHTASMTHILYFPNHSKLSPVFRICTLN